MENSTVGGLRSRSRSKTPFLRSSCDRESCTETEEHTHKSGRKTPVKRSTPSKQLQSQLKPGKSAEPIIEEAEDQISPPPAHRTRGSVKTATEKLIKTSDYSSEESPDRLRGNSLKETAQNQLNYKYEYERVSTSTRRAPLPDVSLSPIHGYNVSTDRSTRFGSPAYSACSTDSSFAEQALADASALLDRERGADHLPSRLYRLAGEYWNKYPKTDYTYSPLSKDRVELAPGQVAVPNMSRRSLQQFRVQGPNTSQDEVDELAKVAWSSRSLRKRYSNNDISDDEGYQPNGGYTPIKQHWWITTLLISIITTVTTTVTTTSEAAYSRLAGPAHRYPYTERNPQEGLLKRTGSALAAPFYWIYTFFKKIVTTTVTTITETVSASNNHVTASQTPVGLQKAAAGRRWPWLLLLLLLPLAGYGCYRCDDIVSVLPARQEETHTYTPPTILNDPDMTKRVAALESWAVSVDSRLNLFDLKLSKIDNLEAQFESYSLKHLQQNLVQIFNIDAENGEAVAAKLKDYFDKHYLHKDQVSAMSQGIYERLMGSFDSSADEEKMRQIVKEYLAVFERRQTEVLVEKVKEYVKEVQVERVESGFDVEAVRRIVAGMLNIYDADKTGLVDYALESAGGQVISTKCTELYQIKTKQYFVLGLPVWWVNTSPRNALTPGAMPAECWAFQGFPGYLVVRTYAIIEVTGFSMEHMSRLLAVDGKIESAPKNFSVYGLRDELDPEPHLFGDYMYDANGTAIQHFPVQHPRTQNIAGVEYPVAYDIIELRVESNHGNPTYSCVYRFRVHGNPLSDIRRATEDSIRESET